MVRRTRLAFSRQTAMDSSGVCFDVRVQPKGEATFFIAVSCEAGEATVLPLSHEEAFTAVEHSLESSKARVCGIVTANEQFNAWLKHR